MNRFLALALALCLILCLCACEKDTPAPTDAPTTSSGDPTKAPTDPQPTDPTPTNPSQDSPDDVPPVEEPATTYKKLYTYIVENGEAADDTWIYTVDTFTMTAGSDGSIRWKKPSSSGTMVWELELKENSKTPILSVTYLTYSASATLEDDSGTLSNFQYSAPERYADTMLNWLKDGISSMLNSARQALEPTGLSLADFLAPASVDPPVTEPPVTEPPVSEPDLNIDPAILGRYRLYKMEDAYGKYGYDTVVASRGYSYIQLNADGTADVCNSGEVLTGLDWDTNSMTITDEQGNMLWPRIDGDTLTISQGPNKLIYLHEDSETWDSVPTGYKKLHDYIVKKGTLTKGSYVFSKTFSGYNVLMIVDKDDVIWWEATFNDVTIKMELVEGGDVHNVTVESTGCTCTATTGLSYYVDYKGENTFANFQTDADSTLAASLQEQAETAISNLVQLAKLAMEGADVTLTYLCATSF